MIEGKSNEWKAKCDCTHFTTTFSSRQLTPLDVSLDPEDRDDCYSIASMVSNQ